MFIFFFENLTKKCLNTVEHSKVEHLNMLIKPYYSHSYKKRHLEKIASNAKRLQKD